MEKNKCEFVSASECFDTSSAMGKAMMGILAIFAQMERGTYKKELKTIIITEQQKQVHGQAVRHHTDTKTEETKKANRTTNTMK